LFFLFAPVKTIRKWKKQIVCFKGKWELYKSQIVGGKKNDSGIITTVEVNKTTHNYGTIQKGSSNLALFSILNTGSHPFVIFHISSSCGCTSIDWDKRPFETGQITTIRVDKID